MTKTLAESVEVDVETSTEADVKGNTDVDRPSSIFNCGPLGLSSKGDELELHEQGIGAADIGAQVEESVAKTLAESVELDVETSTEADVKGNTDVDRPSSIFNCGPLGLSSKGDELE